VALPVVANGEIWTVDDARRCLLESGCDAVMLGRGMVADPGLALAIRHPGHAGLTWAELLPLVGGYWASLAPHIAAPHRAGRLKQWLDLLRRRHPEALAAWLLIREVNDPEQVTALLFAPGQ
jgi:tRNA-dihydrouridine synthase C